jgi:hypothetical protein
MVVARCLSLNRPRLTLATVGFNTVALSRHLAAHSAQHSHRVQRGSNLRDTLAGQPRLAAFGKRMAAKSNNGRHPCHYNCRSQRLAARPPHEHCPIVQEPKPACPFREPAHPGSRCRVGHRIQKSASAAEGPGRAGRCGRRGVYGPSDGQYHEPDRDHAGRAARRSGGDRLNAQEAVSISSGLVPSKKGGGQEAFQREQVAELLSFPQRLSFRQRRAGAREPLRNLGNQREHECTTTNPRHGRLLHDV